MPHQCTECGRTFADGSKEMLSGCPNCGGNKFQFDPTGGSGRDDATGSTGVTESDGTGPDPTSSGPAPDATSDSTDDARRASGGESASADPTGRSWPTYGDEPDSIIGAGTPDGRDAEVVDGSDSDGIIEADETPTEDSAQAAARSGFAGPFEVENGGEHAENGDSDDGGTPNADASERPDTPDGSPTESEETVDESEPSADRPGLTELREELNEQFESIRIESPGQYELNLMELYDREEYIISLKEDGRYVIEVPDTWRDGSDED
jgi:predicted  nucleic acid-binding Zn-ribbon protein